MNGEARKLQLIEALLKVEDESILEQMEDLLSNVQPKLSGKSFAEFAGTITNEEADEWLKNIEEGCEQINPDDWK